MSFFGCISASGDRTPPDERLRRLKERSAVPVAERIVVRVSKNGPSSSSASGVEFVIFLFLFEFEWNVSFGFVFYLYLFFFEGSLGSCESVEAEGGSGMRVECVDRSPGKSSGKCASWKGMSDS